MRAGLWLLDRAAGPYPETEADRIRQRRKERLRRAFPDIDVDGTGPWPHETRLMAASSSYGLWKAF
jgi:hypothetical protein